MPDRVRMGSWRNVSVLITGSSGFLGQRLAWMLGKRGAIVHGLDYRDDELNLESFTQADVRDFYAVQRVIAESKPSVIFHLAAITQVVDAKLIPLQTFQTNIMGTANVLTAAKQMDVGISTVVASSDKAYGKLVTYSDGTPTGRAANEHTYLDPYHPYDVSKAAADFIARCYAKVYDQRVSVTRCGNIYGPGDTNWQRIVPDTIRAILDQRSLYVRTDGTQRREYNYVDDIIDAYTLVADDLRTGGETGISWTISDLNAVYSTTEIAEFVAKVMGKKLNIEILGNSYSEEQEIYLNSSLIRKELGWVPRISMSNGIAQTVEWMKQYLYD